MRATKYKLIQNEVLMGSALFKSEDKANYSRIDYMLNNIKENLALKYFLKSNKLEKNKQVIDLFKKKYIDYRKNWVSQPENVIKKKYSQKELIDKNIIPLCLDIETAAICDLGCPFCFRQFTITPDKIMDENKCYDLIDQAAELGIPSIKFNWRGEPLLHPKITDFIKYAKKRGILETIINTNATKLNNELGLKIIESGLDFMIYSFDGGTKKTYEKNRPGRFKENKFEDVYENIKNFSFLKKTLNKKFPYTKIQMILTADTHKEKDSFFDLFNDIVDDVSVKQLTPRGGKISDLDPISKNKVVEKIKKNNLDLNTPYLLDANGNVKIAKGRIPCQQPLQRLLVTYEGKVAMCCYDWGAKYPVGYTSLQDENKKDYKDINLKVKNNKKGFELLNFAKMPKNYNNIQNKVENIRDIWFGKQIENVRQKHYLNKGEEINICKSCSFKDVYEWV